MEDELDDKIIYQTYVSHMKFVSKIAWGGLPLNLSPVALLAYAWRIFRMYCLRPEVLIVGTLVLVMLLYVQSVDVWSRNLVGRLSLNFSSASRSKESRLGSFFTGDVDKATWEKKVGPIAAYAVQGRRPKMEDRFVINDNINETGVALFAVFDGHGGEFAANYAKDKLVNNLFNRVVEIKDAISGKAVQQRQSPSTNTAHDDGSTPDEKPASNPSSLQERRKSFKKTLSTTDECIKGAAASAGSSCITDNELLSKLDSLTRPITREVKPSKPVVIKSVPAANYFDRNGIVDYGKLITDEVLAADQLLVEAAKRNMDVAGTTALIAILENSKLVVANVGDSRGVMCDSRGNAIPLSFDHKPQQVRERKRIKEAGGFVTFNGVWRVAGILATSRAMGDYPLKDKRLVIADPDILTFELKDHKPMFVILASDGLWDTFSNEEACAFIKDRLHEADYGAKSLTLASYYKGSLDNITVLIINFLEKAFSFQRS